MTALSSARLARLLVRPSTAAFVAFVADCYDARGWTVSRRPGGFLARHPRTGRTERVAVVGARTRLTAPRSVEADVVVARRDAPWARAVASASSARFVGPAELREMLLYGFDRDHACDLLSEHFGASLDDSPESAGGTASALAAVLVVVVVGATVGGTVLLAGGVSLSPSSPEAGAGGAPPEPTTVTTASGGRPDPNTVSTFPSGLDDGGIRNVDTVAESHRTAVSGFSYDLLVEQRRTRSADFDGRWNESRQFATVESRTNYLLIIEGTGPVPPTDETRARYVAYADGNRVYVKSLEENGSVRYASRRILPSEEDIFTDVTTTYIRRYLDTSRSDISRVVYRRREVYLVTALGTPHRIHGNVSDYRATAIVYPDGFVTGLSATYTVGSGNETRHIEVRYTYDEVGEATVTRPEWVDKRSNGNWTHTPVGPD